MRLEGRFIYAERTLESLTMIFFRNAEAFEDMSTFKAAYSILSDSKNFKYIEFATEEAATLFFLKYS